MNDVLVIIPCYKARNKIRKVVESLHSIGFSNILVVDDCCPESSTSEVDNNLAKIVRTNKNSGVGGAFLYGLKVFTDNNYFENIRYIAKIDADGQHSPKDLVRMVRFIALGKFDLVKGNRYALGREPLRQPFIRKIGNVGLSFFNKLSTGYWSLNDPVNGLIIFNRIYITYLSKFPLSERYLFETSILYYSALINGKVADHPNEIIYDNEISSLSVSREFLRFFSFHISGFIKRIRKDYLYPNFDLAFFGLLGSITLPVGIISSLIHFLSGILSNSETEFGSIAIDMLLILVGYMSILFFMQRDRIIREVDFSVSEYLDE